MRSLDSELSLSGAFSPSERWLNKLARTALKLYVSHERLFSVASNGIACAGHHRTRMTRRGRLARGDGLLAALAPIATGAPAMGGGRIATACSNETVNPGFGNVSARFVLHGGVSCTEAHRMMRAYARAIADGRCTSEICTEVVFAGGWTCSATIPALQRPNRPIWGCERSGASLDVYKATRQSGAPANPASFTIAGELSGVAATSAGNAWVVGSVYSQRKNSPDRSNYKTVILHWNGTKWA